MVLTLSELTGDALGLRSDYGMSLNSHMQKGNQENRDLWRDRNRCSMSQTEFILLEKFL